MFTARVRWVLLTLSLAGGYLVAGAGAWHLVDGANRAARLDQLVAERHGAREQARGLIDRVLERATFGLYRPGSARDASLAQMLASARAAHQRARRAAWVLAAAGGWLLVVVGALAARARLAPRAAIGHLLAVSALFLAVGLLTPILTIVTHDTLPVVGEVVLAHDSRGVVSTVRALVASGNLVVAMLLGIFSAVIPVLKLAVAVFALAPVSGRPRRAAEMLLNLIGRWSMTDVFVVAVLLAFLAADTARLTDARLGPGLYFFAGYGLLSMLAGHLMVAHRQRLVAGNGKEMG